MRVGGGIVFAQAGTFEQARRVDGRDERRVALEGGCIGSDVRAWGGRRSTVPSILYYFALRSAFFSFLA